MKELFKKLVVAFLFLAAVPVFAQVPKNADWDKPSSFGPTPSVTPEREIRKKVNLSPMDDEGKPNGLKCGETYQVDVTATQRVEQCEGFDYTPLYDRAKFLADERINQIQCAQTDDCLSPYRWYGYWNWTCKGTEATVQVTEFVTCPAKGATLTAGYGTQAKTDKKKPLDKPKGGPPPSEPVTNGEFVTESGISQNVDWALACDSKPMPVAYTYEVNSPSAQALETGMGKSALGRNFEFYFKLAEAEAKKYHDQFKCSPPANCKLNPFKVDSASWTANGGAQTITIVINFTVQCVKK